MAVTTDAVRDALRRVIDPELGLSIVDLGLVYRVEANGGHVSVDMTMTSRACPLGELLTEQAKATIRRNVPGVESVSVNLVWEPPWSPSLVSGAATRRLGPAEP